MIADSLLAILLLATAARLVRELRARRLSLPAPRRGSSFVLGWTASPLLHATLGILAAATALRGPSDRGPLNGPRSPGTSPIAIAFPDPAPRLSGERMPDPPRFDRPPVAEPEPAPAERPEKEATAERRDPEPPAPRAPEPPRGLAEERFHVLVERPGPGASPAAGGGPPRPLRALLRPGLSLPATLRRGLAERSPGLPAPTGRTSLAAAGLRPRGAWTLPVVWSAPRPGLARPAPGLPFPPGARAFSARTGPMLIRPGPAGPLRSEATRRVFPAIPASRPEASGTLLNPAAVNGTDLCRARSELNGTSARPMPAGLSGTDLKGRR